MVPVPLRLSVVVPVYKSSEILPSLHARLTKVLREMRADYELVLVDDASPDGSWAVLCDLAERDERLVAVRLRRNAGYDAALLAGLRHSRYDLVVLMDDDLQHAPEDIPALVAKISAGYDVVYGRFDKKQQSLLKNIGSWVNGKLAEVVVQKPRGLYLSPFKVLRREIISEVVSYDGPYPYLDGFILRATSSIGEVSLTHHRRAAGEGQHGLIRSTRILLNFLTTFSLLPLRVATLGGLALSLTAAVTGVALVLANVLFGFGLDSPGWTSIVLVTIILGGGQLMAIGIVGEYVGRTYLKLSGRPQYVVGDVRRASRAVASSSRT